MRRLEFKAVVFRLFCLLGDETAPFPLLFVKRTLLRVQLSFPTVLGCLLMNNIESLKSIRLSRGSFATIIQ